MNSESDFVGRGSDGYWVISGQTNRGLNPIDVRFSNRPVGVKHFQTIRRCSVDVAHGLALLFGIGTRALPSWDSRTRWSNLCRGLAVRRTAGPSGHANSPRPSSREGHHFHHSVELAFPSIGF